MPHNGLRFPFPFGVFGKKIACIKSVCPMRMMHQKRCTKARREGRLARKHSHAESPRRAESHQRRPDHTRHPR